MHNYVVFDTSAKLVSLTLWGALICVRMPRGVVISRNNLKVLGLFLCIGIFALNNGLDSIFLPLQYLAIALIIDLFIIKRDSMKFFQSLGDFMAVSLVLMTIGYLLIIIGGFEVLSVHEYHDGFKINNFGWFFVKKNADLINEIRPSAYLDEPGSVSLVSLVILLYFRSKNVKYKLENMLLFLPLFTFSLSHFLLVILFIIIYKLNSRFLLFGLASLGILFFLLPQILKRIDSGLLVYIEERTVVRLEKFLSGEDEGRDAGFTIGEQLFGSSVFGMSRDDVLENYPNYVVENFFTVFIDYGWILGLFYLGLVLSFFNQPRSGSLKRYAPIIFVSLFLFQRPSFIYVLYLLIMMNFVYEKKGFIYKYD